MGSILDDALLNNEQREAVLHGEGPLLILAGAGSGKTRVLTHRVAYLIEQGVNPWNILAITFTNKAAGEMRERVDKLVGLGSESVWVATFHSTCSRILRRHIDRIGYDTSFSIYDTDDQKNVMKEACRRLQIDNKVYREKSLLAAVSAAKQVLRTPADMEKEADGMNEARVAKAYGEYQRLLKASNALDFDDLLVLTVQLFEQCPDVLENYQNRFRYILVDEYQDTNLVQFRLVSMLASKYRNLCVVGDDDQSIYKFRGADIRNILGFEKVFPDTRVIKLEQNYRSTGNILNVANAVIANNHGRKAKRLWTDKGPGEKVHFRHLHNGYEEAEYIIGNISSHVQNGTADYGDHAVLYRTNAQSRVFEEKLIYANMPYKIIGGVNFYARKEIKDLLAYLKVVENGRDDVAVKRIINVPKRGIGTTTIGRVDDYAAGEGMSFYDALLMADSIPGLGRGASKILPFTMLIQTLRQKKHGMGVAELLREVIDMTGYVRELEEEHTDEAKSRIENIDELVNKAVDYDDGADEPTLTGFLEEVSLVADIDSLEDDGNYIALMTLHSAKGLEFPYVYLAGMEEGLFPSYMSIMSEDGDAQVEEERRLCYVGITRAMKELTLTAVKQRMVRGDVQFNAVSRFIAEIPDQYMETGSIRQGRYDSGAGSARAAESYGGKRNPGEVSAPSWGRQPQGGRSSDKALEAARAHRNLRSKPIETKQFKVTKADSLDYTVGDRVSHVKFGEGTVLDITDGGRDYEVKVDFDKAGVKKMFASFAKLKKIL